MGELILIKLGGSVITDKNKRDTIRADNIRRIAREIRAALEQKPGLRLVIGHGGGSFGHFPAAKYKINEGIKGKESWRGYAETRSAMTNLNHLLTEIFLEEGVDVVSLQPSSSAICENGKLEYLDVRPIRQLLKNNQIPVIYGDAVLDRVKGVTIASTEDLFYYLTSKLSPTRLVYVGEVSGVFDSDPHKNPNAKLIPEISNENYDSIRNALGGSHGVDATGGMLTKVGRMYELVKVYPSLEVLLVSGEEAGMVQRSLVNGDVRGTFIRYKGESPIPKYLVVEINGVLVKRAVKPWFEMLKILVGRGIIAKEDWEGKFMPVINNYFGGKVSRDEAVKVVSIATAESLKGKRHSEIAAVADEAMSVIRQNYDPYVMALVDYAKKSRKYKLVLVANNFNELTKRIADDVGADLYYDVALEVKDDIITGKTVGQFMTSQGKAWAVKDIIEKGDTVKERVMYIGANIQDWPALREAGVGILYQPIGAGEELTKEEKAWADDVLKLVRSDEVENLIVLSSPPDMAKVKKLIDK
jgi:isopentenyl phosphate kinase